MVKKKFCFLFFNVPYKFFEKRNKKTEEMTLALGKLKFAIIINNYFNSTVFLVCQDGQHNLSYFILKKTSL